MRKLTFLFALLLCGCSTLRTVGTALFTGAHLADLEITGVQTSACTPITAAQLASALPPAVVLGDKSIGCLMGISRVGEAAPVWIFCAAGSQAKTCAGIASNARVTITGQPLGGGGVFLPTHIRVEDH